MSLEGLLLNQRYRVTAPIGEGPHGAVYRATDERHADRTVALKFLKHLVPEGHKMLERFARECQVLRELDHPHIVTLYEHGQHEGMQWIAMEYAPSGSLQLVLDEDGPMDVYGALEILLQLCAALEVAHAAGLVHRDVCPANLLVGHRGRVLLADFGQVLLPGAERITRHDSAVASVAIAPPEQRQDPHDGAVPASDIYAAAATLLALLTAQAPPDLFLLQPNGHHWGATPPWLRPVILRAGSHRTEDRHRSAIHLAESLLAAAREAELPRLDELQQLWDEIRPEPVAPRLDELEAALTDETAPPPPSKAGGMSVALGVAIAMLVLAGALWLVWAVLSPPA